MLARTKSTRIWLPAACMRTMNPTRLNTSSTRATLTVILGTNCARPSDPIVTRPMKQ